VASGVAIAGAALASGASVGPGRVLAAVLVIAWSAAALFVAMQRPRELLSWLMAAGAAIGAVAVISAAEAGKVHAAGSGSYKAEAALLAISVALLPAMGLHVALSLPRGTLEHRVRRGIVISGYIAAVPLAASFYADRPDLSLASLGVAAGLAAAIGMVGYVRRCQRASTEQERARLQWVAWGAVVAAAIAAGAVVLALGLANMQRGVSAKRSQRLMRLRVGLQAVAIFVILLVLWWRGH